MKRLQPGMIVQHFKGESADRSSGNSMYLYKILGITTHVDTNEELVVYQALYEPFAMFVQLFKTFTEIVDNKKYPNVKQKYIFEEYKKMR